MARSTSRTLALNVELWTKLTDGESDSAVAQRLGLTPIMVWRAKQPTLTPNPRFVAAVKDTFPAHFSDLFITKQIAA